MIGTKVFLHQMVAYLPTFQTQSTKINTFGPSRFPNALYQKCSIFCTKEIKTIYKTKKYSKKNSCSFLCFCLVKYFSPSPSSLLFFDFIFLLFFVFFFFFFSNFFSTSPFSLLLVIFFFLFHQFVFFFLFLLFFFFEKQNTMITTSVNSSSSFETKGHMNFLLST